MGRVFLAEQREPIRRRVAIKLIRTSLASRDAELRFAAERQAMARLAHPAVAHVYEAGTSEGGFPYFAMEYVAGVPLTDYCDGERLTIEDRLRLFVAVCDGVQHAHQKGILHRDLKPSNLLVTEVEGRPTPKIIDFGIAKALDHPLRAGALQRRQFAMGTPAYMSPEALRGESGLDLDTRSDVYSLGVVLYELLAGTRPHDPTGLGIGEYSERVREQDAPRPSHSLARLDEAERARLARSRGLAQVELERRLRGDLDWIVAKATAVERRQRYSSASELAADLTRHLRHEPVSARAPTRRYRAVKFIRRHRLGVAAAALALIGLVSGMFGALYGLSRARAAEAVALSEAERAGREAQTAERVSGFLVGLFQGADPFAARQATVRDVLDKGSVQLERLRDEPLVRARLQTTIGEVYSRLGLFDQARPLLAAAVAAAEEHAEPDDPLLADSLRLHGMNEVQRGSAEAAIPLLTRALGVLEHRLSSEHPDLVPPLLGIGAGHTLVGNIDAARGAFRRALDLAERAPKPNAFLSVRSRYNLAALEDKAGRYQDAAILMREAHDASLAAFGPTHPTHLVTKQGLGYALAKLGRYGDAEPLLDRASETLKATLGPEHFFTLETGLRLGYLYSVTGRPAAAEELLRPTIASAASRYGSEDPTLIQGRLDLARSLRLQGRVAEAREPLGLALARAEALGGAQHPELVRLLWLRAELSRDLGEDAQADADYRRALAIGSARLDADNPDVIACRNDYRSFLLERGREEDAAMLE